MTAVRQIMDADVPTIGADDDVDNVLQIMRQRDQDGVIVVDADAHVVGIITDADLVIADEHGELHLPHYIQLFGGVIYVEPLKRYETRLRKALASKVRDMMTADPVTVDAGEDVEVVARTMATTGFNRLPVVEDGRLVGVVTRADVLTALHGEPA